MNPSNIINRILASELKTQILRSMCAGEHGRTGREWAAFTKVSPPTVLTHLQELVDEGIVICTRIGSSHTFQLNTHNIVVETMIMPLFQKEKDLLSAFGQQLQANLDTSRIETVFFYGSIARGTAKATSDWDVLILCKHAEDIDPLKSQLDAVIPTLRAAFASTLDIKIFTVQDFCRRYQAGDVFPKSVFNDYLHSVVSTPLHGTSLTKVLESYGNKNHH